MRSLATLFAVMTASATSAANLADGVAVEGVPLHYGMAVM